MLTICIFNVNIATSSTHYSILCLCLYTRVGIVGNFVSFLMYNSTVIFSVFVCVCKWSYSVCKQAYGHLLILACVSAVCCVCLIINLGLFTNRSFLYQKQHTSILICMDMHMLGSYSQMPIVTTDSVEMTVFCFNII